MVNYGQQSDGLKQAIMILFFILLIIALFVGLGFTIFKDSTFVQNLLNKEKPINQTIVINQTYVTLTIRPEIEFEIPFSLSENGIEKTSGFLTPNILEKYTTADVNSTYIIETKGNDYYYFMKQPCQIYYSDIDCKFSPKKKAFVAVYLTENEISIEPIDGIIQDPIICITWGSYTNAIRIEQLQQTFIPNRLLKFVDICYAVTHDIIQKETYNIQIEKNDVKNRDLIQFHIIDKEIDPSIGVYSFEVDTGIPDYIKEIVS